MGLTDNCSPRQRSEEHLARCNYSAAARLALLLEFHQRRRRFVCHPLLHCLVLRGSALPVLQRHSAFEALLFFRPIAPRRSEEHTSELQSLMRISYAVFCLKKKKKTDNKIGK